MANMRPRTKEEYKAQAMLLGDGWFYDDFDHTMNIDNGGPDNHCIVAYHPDTMDFLGYVYEDERYHNHKEEWKKRDG